MLIGCGAPAPTGASQPIQNDSENAVVSANSNKEEKNMGIIFIILVVGLVAWLLTQGQLTGGCHTSARTTVNTETPLEILRQRYARGEIDRDEYESRKHDLI